MNKRTQQHRILDLLRSKKLIPLPEILNLRIASYTRRIFELRQQGFVIETFRDGNHSLYSLIREPQNALDNRGF